MVEANGVSNVPGPPVHPATVALRRISELSRLFEQRLQHELTVNPTDLLAMQHLISRGPMTAGDLAQAIDHSPAATTTVIDRLEGLGHVRRESHPTDRRVTQVVPTRESRDKAENIIWEMIRAIDEVAASRSSHDQAVITDYLSDVLERYAKMARPSDQ